MKNQVLLTPGPLTTSSAVKLALGRDLGSRDKEFCAINQSIHKTLLQIAFDNKVPDNYDVIIIQGSGTYGVESVIGTTVKPTDTVLIITNGRYGERMVQMCVKAGIKHRVLSFGDNVTIDPYTVAHTMLEYPEISHICIVHLETTTGLLNPIKEIGSLVKEIDPSVSFIVDAMSSFGSVPISICDANINYLISSANKCIQGVPGFSFVIANTDHLGTHGYARTVSLDLLDQWQTMKRTGQFRFTPPIQALLGFSVALSELVEETVGGRNRRYVENQRIIAAGLTQLGFRLYIEEAIQGPVITTFLYPDGFDFDRFYNQLLDRGFVIYPGKLTKNVNSFRIGNIGAVDNEIMHQFVAAVISIMEEMEMVPVSEN